MIQTRSPRSMDRRGFLHVAAVAAGAAVTAGMGACAPARAGSGVRSLAEWAAQPGIQIYTVRDRLEPDYEGTLARLAEPGTGTRRSPARRVVAGRTRPSIPSSARPNS